MISCVFVSVFICLVHYMRVQRARQRLFLLGGGPGGGGAKVLLTKALRHMQHLMVFKPTFLGPGVRVGEMDGRECDIACSALV